MAPSSLFQLQTRMARHVHSSKSPPQSFFKLMAGDFFDKLLIPPAYADQVEGILPPEITLTTRDGVRKKVMVSVTKTKLYFKSGWSDFVKDKSINSGDLLVFHNVDGSEFKVTIYRRETGCEDMLVSEDETNVIHIDSDHDDSTTDMEIEKKERKRVEIPKAIKQRESAAVVEAAEKFVSKHPFFKITMTYAYVHAGYVHVPASFVREFLAQQLSQIVMLRVQRPNKSSWPVKLAIDGKCRCRMSLGWSEFVRDNNLHRGDVCAFQMIENVKVVFIVNVFRSTR